MLPYIENPFQLITKVLAHNFKYILIDRNAFIELNRHVLTIQVVPPEVYEASYPAWFFNEELFIKAFSSVYTIEKEFDSPFVRPILVNNVKAHWKGFLLKNKNE